MANLTRRQWLKVGLAVGGMVTFGLSYRDVAKRARRFVGRNLGQNYP